MHTRFEAGLYRDWGRLLKRALTIHALLSHSGDSLRFRIARRIWHQRRSNNVPTHGCDFHCSDCDGQLLFISAEPLTSVTIIRLSKIGLSDDTIIQFIDQEVRSYQVSADDIDALRKASVSDRVISALLKHSMSGPSDRKNPSPPTRLILAEGTRIRLRLMDSVQSARARTGDRVEFEITNDVGSGGLIVLHRGDIAVGSVKRAEPKKWFGRGATIEISVEYVRLPNGDRVHLVGRSYSAGPGRPPFFMPMHGYDTEIPGGTEVDAYVSEDMPLDSPR